MLLILLLISLLPVIIWAYIFSYIDWDRLNKSRFIMGIFAWVVWVMPIIFYEQIFSFFKLSFLLSVFSTFSLISFLTFLAVFCFFVFSVSLIYTLIYKQHYKNVLFYLLKSFIYFMVLVVFVSSFLYLLDSLWLFSSFSLWEDNLTFSGTALNSFKLILFYYVFVAFTEELSKHTNFLWYSINYIDSVQKWVLYAIFVALWFVFIENILYLYNVLSYDNFSAEFFRVYLFRFVFSLMVHVFCSSLIAYYFSKVYIYYKKIVNFRSVKLFFTGIFLAVSFHAFFDISLTYGWSFMMIIYFLVGYFYLTGVFYKG